LRIHDPYERTKDEKSTHSRFAGGRSRENASQRQTGILQRRIAADGFRLLRLCRKDNKTIAGEILGTDAQHKKTQEVLCQEYILKTNRLIYRIRPKDDKHPALLPVGETAEFRIHKDKMLLRVPESDGKEREYIVVSMTPRSDAADTKASAKVTAP